MVQGGDEFHPYANELFDMKMEKRRDRPLGLSQRTGLKPCPYGKYNY
jgi:hypothetical protein